jgi:hypothetical protein
MRQYLHTGDYFMPQYLIVAFGLLVGALLLKLFISRFLLKKKMRDNSGNGVASRIRARLSRIREHREKENPFGVMRYNNPKNDPNKGK